MKRSFTFLLTAFFVALMAFSASAQTTTHENLPGSSAASHEINQNVKPPVTWTYHAGAKSGLLYDNGPLVNIPGAAGMPDTSRLQSALSMSTLGAGVQLSGTSDNRIADDFIIPDSTWVIDSIVFYAYQTGSTLASTLTGANLQVWDNKPGMAGSLIVWGDVLTNRMTQTYWTRIYRDSETSPAATNRPIMAATLVPTGLYLPAGTWWLDFQCEGSASSGPWAPPITINGQTTTGNAIQKTTAGWADLMDTGTNTQQGLPFKIYGTVTSTIGLDRFTGKTAITLFPNPASGYVSVKGQENIRTVELFNQLGQLVYSNNPDNLSTTIDLGNVPAGLYIVNIHTDNGVSNSKLIVR